MRNACASLDKFRMRLHKEGNQSERVSELQALISISSPETFVVFLLSTPVVWWTNIDGKGLRFGFLITQSRRGNSI